MESAVVVAVPLSVTILFLAILLNIFEFERDDESVKYEKSKVETGSMTLFAIACFLLYRFQIGVVSRPFFIRVLGAVIVYGSVIVNVYSRTLLKNQWSNQIRVRKAHQLICKGPYRVVRHPLYTTTITMIYGASIIYGLVSVAILNTIFFIPMMIYRAKQEEKALLSYLEEYSAYQLKVPRLFPFLRRPSR